MKDMNKKIFKKKKVVFNGQCMCPTNCTSKKNPISTMDIKKIYLD